MAEHGIAVKLPQPAKNSPAAACRSAGAGHCLVLALDLSWLLVVMSACFYPLRRASESVRPECIWGTTSPNTSVNGTR
jgi:hypothetical protein